MKFFHISHTDLDGYGCQLISNKIFPDGKYYNANYGAEVQTAIQSVLDEIETLQQEEIFFLLSDLNLTTNEAKKLDKQINHLNKNNYNIKLQLLDHHSTGEQSAKKYSWYFLDNTKCATKIVFEYFIENYQNFLSQCSDGFKTLIEAIDDVDIWCEDDEYFEFGKVLMSLIAQANEINPTLFPDENRDYRLNILAKAIYFINRENGYILLDDYIQNLKKEYLNLATANDTLDNLSAKYLVYLLEDKKDDLTIYYQGHKGLLTFTLSNISIPANTFLKANKDYDFFINVGKRGTVALRADGKLNVATLAQKMANGGGHPNASGGAFKNWKEIVLYKDIKQFIEQKLQEISISIL
jgi:oligoribonuclease NrnB/cAMP/cGMP phosphodiesterase (DHH superfamily)